jgi:hypothetical protein
VCRDTLSLLSNGDHNIFITRGSHPALTPVDLPLWLPLATLNGMVQLYRGRLLKELVKMIKTQRIVSKAELDARFQAMSEFQGLRISNVGFLVSSNGPVY